MAYSRHVTSVCRRPAFRWSLCALVIVVLLATVPIASLSEEMSFAEWPSVIVAGDDNYPPYEFLDANGNPAGFNVELTQAIPLLWGWT